jgi:TonB-linked SusC/RagA family outer membrane protein
MKMCLLLVVFGVLGAKNIYAQSSFVKNIALQKGAAAHHSSSKLLVSVNVKNLNLADALRKVAHKANVGISFDAKIVPNRKVTLQAKNMPIYKAMQYLLRGTGLEAVRSKSRDVLMIQKKPKLKFASAQQGTVSGTVTDATTGTTLPGVNILLKGTSTGTSTDRNGHYKLTVPSLQDTLRFSYIGYTTQIVPIKGRTSINIAMKSNVVSGKQLVVVGYGKENKVTVTGAQSTINTQKLAKAPVENVGQALAGRMSGIVQVQRSGEPGYSTADIWIRGISTFNGNRNPLILVNGVERSSLRNVNPDNIKSLTVLKDASATAVYGSRGGNGVILVQTKSGKKGPPQISFNYYEGLTTQTKVPKLVDGVTYMKLRDEAEETRGQTPDYSQEAIEKTASGKFPYRYPNVNWYKNVFNKFAHQRRGNLTISGGGSVANYYVNLSYLGETGMFKTDPTISYDQPTLYNKYGVNTQFNIKATKSTTVNLGITGDFNPGRYPAGTGIDINSSSPTGGIFSEVMHITPVEFPIAYPGGKVANINPDNNKNPYAVATQHGYQNLTHSYLYTKLGINEDLDKWVKGLEISGIFSFNVKNNHDLFRSKTPTTYYLDPKSTYSPDGTLNLNQTGPGTNFLNYYSANGGSNKLYYQAKINYKRSVKKNDITGLLVFNQSSQSSGLFAGSYVGSIPFRRRAFSGRVTYTYDNRYVGSFNFGYTGSENFAPENRYGFFPAYGAGWIISNEKFFKPFKSAIQFLKIRYSNGLVGTDESAAIGRRFGFETLLNSAAPGYGYGQESNRGFSGIAIQNYGEDVTWSRPRKQDLGFNLTTFNHALSITFDLYKEHRTGILTTRTKLPEFVGLNSNPFGNVGIVDNKGFDGTVKFDKEIGRVFLSLKGTFSYSQNKVIKNGKAKPKYPWQQSTGTNILAQFGYVAEGLFKSQEEIDNSATQFGTVLPGDIKYKDLNHDGVINSYDEKQIGKGDVPSLTYGLAVNANYKNFGVGLFFQGENYADIELSGESIQPFAAGGGLGNLYEAVAKSRWTKDNPRQNVMYPRLGFGEVANKNNYKPSTWWVRNSSFFRLRLAQVTYSLPHKLMKGTGIGNVQFFFRGTNLLTISPFKLWDPELTTTSNGSAYPLTKLYAVGVNIKF